MQRRQWLGWSVATTVCGAIGATGTTAVMAQSDYPKAGASLRYIVTQVAAGRFLRDLHHWGANMLIAVVVLHASRCSCGAVTKNLARPPGCQAWCCC